MIQSGCVLKVGVIGLNHKTANLAFREAMARGAATLSAEKLYFFPHPVVLLSTCNRTEIYFGGEDLALVHIDILRWLRSQIPDAFEHRLYSYFGIDCFAHLGSVAGGLDSAIIAETEIQRQVKIAYAKSCEYSTLPSCLHYVFQKALKLGKLVRNQVQIDRKTPTLFQAIWQLAADQIGNVAQKKILLIGHSEINRRMAFFLTQRGVQNFSLSTQNPMRVSLQGCFACDRSEIRRWRDYDLIISAAKSDQYLIEETVERIGNLRLQPTHVRPQVIFDLSVPRNIDPSVGTLQNITLYNIEQINEWIDRKRAMHSDQLARSKALIWEGAVRLARAYRKKIEYRQMADVVGLSTVK